MSEETHNTNPEAAAPERVGFCQDCGKALTRETVRAVGSGVFCEPCLATRIGAAPYGGSVPPVGAQAGGQTGSQTGGAQPGAPSGAQPGGWGPVGSGGGSVPGGFVPAPSGHLPNPTLAGLLGIIPGVGAMYNGQFVKGLLHVAVFAVLVMLSNNVNGVFGLFVAGWVFYQIFDAYQTALAKRNGTPLPNHFGFNELADRIANGQGWSAPHPGAGQAAGAQAPPPPPAGWASTDPSATPYTAAPYTPVNPAPPAGPGYGPQGSYGVPPANWAGYTHPSNFAAGSPPPPGYPPYAPPAGPTMAQEIRGAAQQIRDAAQQIHGQAYRDAGFAPPAYSETFTGVPVAGAATVPTIPPTRRFPVGALWLIGFGVLVLVGNMSSEWHVSGFWILAGLFGALAVWTLMRRLEWAGGYSAVTDGEWPRLACMLRAPIMLLTLSVIFLLQAVHVATFGQSWPLLPIALGTALFLERTVGVGHPIVVPPVGGYYAAPVEPLSATGAPGPAAEQAHPEPPFDKAEAEKEVTR